MSNGINLNPLFNFFLNMSDKADDLTEDEKKELKKLGIVSDADLKSYKELMAGVKAEGASERELVLGTIQPILDSMLAKAGSGNEGVVGKILINALKEANGDADIEKLVSALNTQAATLEPKELTDDEKKAKVEALVKQFATGNMTLFEAEKALADIGITCYFVDLPETKERCIEFEFGDRVYTVICNAAAVNDGFGGVVTEAFDDQKVYELYEKYGSKVSNYIICLAYNKSLDFETNGNGQIQAMYYTLNTENWPDGVAKTLAALETWLAQPEESEEEKAIKELIDKYAKEDFVDANVIEDLVTLLKTANIQYDVTKTPVMNREITTLSFKLNDKSYEFYTTQEVNLDSKPDDTTNDDDGITDNDTTTGGVTNGAGNTNNDTTTGGATNGADGSDDNGKVDNTTGSGSVNNATTETAATGYSLNTLKAQYNFADMDISRYFKKTTDENGNEKYTLNQAGIKAAFGTEAKSAEELISFMSGNFNYEAVLKQFKVQSNDKFKSYLVISGDKAKLDFAKIEKDFPNQNIKTFGQLLNAINAPKKETTGSTGSTGTNGSTGATGATVTTYTQAQLAGLDSNAISTYFTKQADGTYVMNAEKIVADFPASTYGTIDTLEKLKTAIEKKNNAEKVNNENSVVKYGSKDLEKYNFADMDISRYFSKSIDENGDDIYTLNQAGIKAAFGTEAKSAEELISFMSSNFNYEAVLKQFKVQSNDKFKSYLVISGDKAKLDFAKIEKDFPNQNIKTFGQLLNAINAPKKETTGSTGSTGTNGSTGATGATVTTYTQAQLAGLDSNAISTYFTKQADGTYVMNANKIAEDFPEKDYGKIDTPEKLKTAIANKANADNTSSVAGAGGAGGATNGANASNGTTGATGATEKTGDFASYAEVRSYLFSGAREAVRAAGITNFPNGVVYENIAETVAHAHEKDFASVTKEQLIEEFKAEYNRLIGGTQGTAGTNNSVTTYTQAQLTGLDSNAISTYFTKQADGTYVMNANKIAEDFPEKDYGKIDTPEKLKTAIANKANADNTSSVAGAGGAGGATNGANASNGTTGATGATEKTGDFASYAEVRSYLFSGAREDVREAGITKFPKGVVYENIAETVANAHKNDFASVTKKQLIEEFTAEYNRLIGGNEGTATEWTKEYLQKTYHFTDSDIGHFFSINGDKYKIDSNATKSCFGKEINNILDLLKAMQNDGIAIGFIYGAYSMGSDKYLQYFTETVENGEKRYTMKTDKIKQDFPNQNITTIGQLKAAVDTKGTNASNGTRGDDSVVTKYTQAQLSDLDSNAISTYFTKQADGTYVMNTEKIVADFPEKDYGKIDTPEKLKTAIANKAKADNTSSVAGAGGAGGAASTDKTAEANTQIKNNATAVLSLLNKNDSETIMGNKISSTIVLLEQGYASNNNQSTKVNTTYSLDTFSNISFSNSYVTKMFNELFNHIKTVVGTDNFDEKTLKQLYQTAWQMSYYSYPSSQENDISDFLTQVYNKFKAIFIRLQNKPEYLDIFTGKTTNSTGSVVDTRAINAAYQSTGGGWVTCDSTAQTYNDGSIHVSDDQSDANLQKAIKTLREKLQKAYPNIPAAKLNTLINDAVKKAVENIGKQNKTEIPNHFSITSTRTYATTIANLATYYFEQALYITALTDNTFTNGNPKTETKTINVDETTKAKYKAAATSINGMLTDIYDSSHIKGLLANAGIDGDYLLEMDVDSYGNMRFTNLGTKTAYEKLLSEMKTKSGFKNSGLTESEFKQIYNAAWLDSYNSFNNSQKYNLNDVLNKVVANMQKIMNKLSTNPEYLNLIKGGSSMTKITTSTTSVNYGGTDRTRDYGDGNVHLSDDNSDKTYQKYIEELRTKLKDSYVPPLSEYQFNTWFTQAQKDAIYECQENKNDITKDLVYGSLSNMSGAGGTRKGDHSNIEINKLMELIAYKFDKIMYKNVFGAA